MRNEISSVRFNGHDYYFVGKQGPQGPKGADGTVTFEELTESQIAQLKGEKGDKGDDGVSTDFKYQVISESDYNALTTKDSTTLYMIPV